MKEPREQREFRRDLHNLYRLADLILRQRPDTVSVQEWLGRRP